MFPDKDAPSGLQMVLEITRVITQRCHTQGFMDILHVCEEDLAAARAQGAWCKREVCLPAPLPLKACGNMLRCCMQWSNFDYLLDMELLNSEF